MLKEGKVYVLKDKKLRSEVIWIYHDIPVVRHGGQWKMTELVTRNYWWPEVTRDIEKYVEECNLCQRIKNRIKEITGKLKLSEVSEKLWIHLIVDFITKLLIVARKDAILVVYNRLSKITHFVGNYRRDISEGIGKAVQE